LNSPRCSEICGGAQINENEALEKGLKEILADFVKHGTEVYASAKVLTSGSIRAD